MIIGLVFQISVVYNTDSTVTYSLAWSDCFFPFVLGQGTHGQPITKGKKQSCQARVSCTYIGLLQKLVIP